MVAGGLVRVVQTGEIVESTVNAPGATNTKAGFVIFRSDDATGGLHNWFIKLSFGSGSAVNNPSIWFQFGWGSDGAGNLTGNTNTEIQSTVADHNATGFNCNYAAGTGWLSFGLYLATASNGQIINVERVRDTNGAITDDIHCFNANGASGSAIKINQTVRYTGTHSTNNTTGLSAIGNGWRHSLAAHTPYASNTGLGTLAPQLGGYYPELMGVFLGDATNYNTAQALFSFTVYGASHQYIVNLDNNILSTYRILTRYE